MADPEITALHCAHRLVLENARLLQQQLAILIDCGCQPNAHQQEAIREIRLSLDENDARFCELNRFTVTQRCR